MDRFIEHDEYYSNMGIDNLKSNMDRFIAIENEVKSPPDEI